MKVLCIDDISTKGKKLEQIKIGETYTASQCPVHPNNYDLAEVPTYKGYPVSYHKKCFIPLSDIDERELIQHRELARVRESIEAI